MTTGYKLVPLIPTDDMIVAFAEAWYSKRQTYDDPDMLDAYRDMLAVAPDAGQTELDRVTAERDALQQLLNAADERRDLLEGLLRLARQFVVNGIDLGYIQMPEAGSTDPAHDLVPKIEAALSTGAEPKPRGEQLRNQCDGCQAGIPVVNGSHRMGSPGGYEDLMGCTAKLYTHPPAPVAVAPTPIDYGSLDAVQRLELCRGDRPGPTAESPAVPDGYYIMPKSLTAENGAKALLLGEFKLKVTRECPECCELEKPTEGCEVCDGEGEYGQSHTIPWDLIKFIYSKAVKGLAIHNKSK
ncbi:hypothetical protein ACW9H6_01855 [Pseudomonas sp. SDO528_S397]